MQILDSTVTTNILLILYIAWYLFGKKLMDSYSAKKGSNLADKEDSKAIESKKREGSQPFDIELEKLKAQASYIVEEYKESLKVRIDTKRKLYDGLVDLKIYTRQFYHKANSVKDAQESFNKFNETLDKVSDFMSCNKHFIREIDPDFLVRFESQVTQYLQIFRTANDSLNSGEKNENLIEKRNEAATKLLDLIDTYLGKIFQINPSEIPYNKSIQPTASAAAD
jgi:hypothetical protein